ncbi:MAG: hypothetical protein AAF916_04145 [Planctomycetota bacterium]
MSNNEQLYEFVKPWQSKKPGDRKVFEKPYGDMLTRQGVVKPVEVPLERADLATLPLSAAAPSAIDADPDDEAELE